MNSLDKNSDKILIKESLPHNFLAEKMVLSSILFNQEALEITRQNLVVEAFYFKNHQELYRVLIEMDDNKLPIDIVTVTVFLQDNGLLSKIGGIKVLLDLGNQSLTFSFLPEYIRIIKEKFLKRCLIKFGYKIINSGYITNMSLETSLIKIEKELFTITNELSPNKLVTTAQVLNDLFADLKNKFLKFKKIITIN